MGAEVGVKENNCMKDKAGKVGISKVPISLTGFKVLLNQSGVVKRDACGCRQGKMIDCMGNDAEKAEKREVRGQMA